MQALKRTKAYLVVRHFRWPSTATGFSIVIAAWAKEADALAEAEYRDTQVNGKAGLLLVGVEVSHGIAEVNIKPGPWVEGASDGKET